MTAAREASEKGRPLQAFQAASRALCITKQHSAEVSIQVDVAAFALESALDVDNQDYAEAIASELDARPAQEIASTDPRSIIHWQMAQARLTGYNENNFKALGLREALDEKITLVFGLDSNESLTNQTRICNLKLQLGQVNEALDQLQKLNAKFSFDETISWYSRNLLIRATASAEALAGQEVDAIKLLKGFQQRLTMSFGSSDSRIVGIEENLSEIFTKIDQFEDAIECASQVYLWRQANLSASDLNVLRSLWQLALLYLEVSRLETANSILVSLSETLSKDQESGKRILFLQVTSLQASLDVGRGDYASALKKWRIVYFGLVDMYGPSSVDARVESANLAFAMRRTGNAKEACDFLETSQPNRETSQIDESWVDEFAHIEHLECLLDQTHDQAETAYMLMSLSQSWGVIAQHVGVSNRNSIDALAKVADSFLKFGKESSAKEKLELLVSITERERAHSFRGSLARVNSYSRWMSEAPGSSNPVNGYRDLALLDARWGDLESALRISELVRDRTLADRFIEERSYQDLPNKFREEILELSEQIQDLDEEISFTNQLTERIRLESKRNLLAGARGRIYGNTVESKTQASSSDYVPTLDDVRRNLNVGEILISILRSRDEWWALALARDQPARFLKFDDQDLAIAADAWTQYLHGRLVRVWQVHGDRLAMDIARPKDSNAILLKETEICSRLSKAIFSPLEKLLESHKRLIVVGDGDLNGLPIQTLKIADKVAVDELVISYAPSISTFVQKRETNRTNSFHRDLLAIASPDSIVLESASSQGGNQLSGQVGRNEHLKHVQDEVEAIGKYFPLNRKSIWIGDLDTKRRLREASRNGDLEQYRFIHFAGHANADFEDPERSFITLSANLSAPYRQHAITAAELAGLRMNAKLLVLAGCETAVGWYRSTQGLMGFAYAGLAAGSRSELLTLWPIEDYLTAQFMNSLYGRLRRGDSPSDALAQTQRQFFHSGNIHMADPRSWAPYVIYGAD